MASEGTEAVPVACKLRHDWYQTETHIIINVFQKNINSERLKIDCKPQQITIDVGDMTVPPLTFNLTHEVRPDGVASKILATKVEIKLPKVEGIHWGKLEGEESTAAKPIPKGPESTTSDSAVPRGKNWDAVLKDEPIEDENPLNELFKKIYAGGSDEVRKAMNKSFVESGGTVLSTNWNEVNKDKVAMSPPQGVEFKKWDS